MGESSRRRLASAVLARSLAAILYLPCYMCKVTDVHMVFSNHLDVGFNGVWPKLGSDENIVNQYFQVYFDQAVNITKDLRGLGDDRMVYMTHSWLVSYFLDCPTGMGLQCPSPEAQQRFKEAVQRGDIVWHAFPFNAQAEFFNPGLLKYGVWLTHHLDDLLAVPRKLVMSQRDVPGMTRAAIPILYAAGVRGLTVGVNGGSAPPDVPHNTPFWWIDPPSGTRLLTLFHPGGYSGNPVDVPGECAHVEGFPHVLCAAWQGDNQGPHPVSEFQRIMNITRTNFPGANVYGSSFEAFFKLLLEVADNLRLPEVTAEIGDTWMYGVQSDALKVAEYRALLRVHKQLFYLSAEPAFLNFTRFLLKVPEHTWGPDVKTFLPDFHNWDNRAFHARLEMGESIYMDVTYAWQRQRAYLQWAADALSSLPQGREALKELEEVRAARKLHPHALKGRGLWQATNRTSFASPHWLLEIGPSGELTQLQRRYPDGTTGSAWASEDFPLGEIIYQTYTEEDYDAIWQEYLYADKNYWIMRDLGKPNCSLAHPRSARVAGRIAGVWDTRRTGAEDEGFHVTVQLELPTWTVVDAGAPREVWLEIESRADDPRLHLDVVWIDKTPTRLPEALWYKFAPKADVADPESWLMYKLGQPISPLEVVNNGSQSMHGVTDEGISVTGVGSLSWETLAIRSLDVSLVSPGKATPFPKLHEKPDLEHYGISFNLANNIWGTNYLMWQPLYKDDGNIRFRFVIETISSTSDESPSSVHRPYGQLQHNVQAGRSHQARTASVQ